MNVAVLASDDDFSVGLGKLQFDIFMSHRDVLRMRTTVRLKDDLLKQAKRRAAETHRSFTAFLEDAIRASLSPRASARSPRKKVDLPISGKSGTLPGIHLDDSASLHDVMDGIR